MSRFGEHKLSICFGKTRFQCVILLKYNNPRTWSHRESTRENTHEISRTITTNAEELKSKKVFHHYFRNEMTDFFRLIISQRFPPYPREQCYYKSPTNNKSKQRSSWFDVFRNSVSLRGLGQLTFTKQFDLHTSAKQNESMHSNYGYYNTNVML